MSSASRTEWPPTMATPAEAQVRAPPARIASSTSSGSWSSGKNTRFSANRGSPPIAQTSDIALAAAIAPNASGSSTSGAITSAVSTRSWLPEPRTTAASSDSAWSTMISGRRFPVRARQVRQHVGQLTEPKLGGSTTPPRELGQADGGLGFGRHAGIEAHRRRAGARARRRAGHGSVMRRVYRSNIRPADRRIGPGQRVGRLERDRDAVARPDQRHRRRCAPSTPRLVRVEAQLRARHPADEDRVHRCRTPGGSAARSRLASSARIIGRAGRSARPRSSRRDRIVPPASRRSRTVARNVGRQHERDALPHRRRARRRPRAAAGPVVRRARSRAGPRIVGRRLRRPGRRVVAVMVVVVIVVIVIGSGPGARA